MVKDGLCVCNATSIGRLNRKPGEAGGDRFSRVDSAEVVPETGNFPTEFRQHVVGLKRYVEDLVSFRTLLRERQKGAPMKKEKRGETFGKSNARLGLASEQRVNVQTSEKGFSCAARILFAKF